MHLELVAVLLAVLGRQAADNLEAASGRYSHKLHQPWAGLQERHSDPVQTRKPAPHTPSSSDRHARDRGPAHGFRQRHPGEAAEEKCWNPCIVVVRRTAAAAVARTHPEEEGILPAELPWQETNRAEINRYQFV
jgi:hypothetical protein